jgi:hypothetical protein
VSDRTGGAWAVGVVLDLEFDCLLGCGEFVVESAGAPAAHGAVPDRIATFGFVVWAHRESSEHATTVTHIRRYGLCRLAWIWVGVRIRRFLRNHEPNVFPGTYSTCVFNPAKALCQPHNDSKNDLLPALGDCQPLECGNVALTADNITALRAELASLATELAQRPALPPLLQQRLRARHDDIARLLNHQRPES